MALIRLSCPHCRQPSQFDATPEQSGSPVRCPHCQKAMRLPAVPETDNVVAPREKPNPQATKPNAVRCPHCEKPFRVKPEMAGQKAACPHCRVALQLPGKSAATDVSKKKAEAKSRAPTPIIVTDKERAAVSSKPQAATEQSDRAIQRSAVTTSFRTPDGEQVTLREDVTQVQTGAGEIVEIRNLSPEEKRRRRIVRNVVMIGIGIVVLLATAAVFIR